MENTNQAMTGVILRQALLASSGIADQDYKFERAKIAVMLQTDM
jgi:hypothetical protein